MAERVLAGANLLMLPAFHQGDVHHVFFWNIDGALVGPEPREAFDQGHELTYDALILDVNANAFLGSDLGEVVRRLNA